MSVKEAADRLEVHRVTIYKWVKEGRLRAEPGHPVKRRQGLRIPVSEVERLLAGG